MSGFQNKQMPVHRMLSRLFIALGLCLCAAGAVLSFACAQAKPILFNTEEVSAQVESFMDAVCSGSYGQVQSALYGQPPLGMDAPAETPLGQALRELYQDSLSYRLSQEFSASNTGLSVDVSVTALDLEALMDALADSMAAEQADSQQWLAALSKSPLPLADHTVTLNLVHDRTGWYILPEPPVLALISGIPE